MQLSLPDTSHTLNLVLGSSLFEIYGHINIAYDVQNHLNNELAH